MKPQEQSIDSSDGAHFMETRRWWHYFRYEESPVDHRQPAGPFPRWMRFGLLPLETLARIPPDQYVEMRRDAQIYTVRHWLPVAAGASFALLGLALLLFPAARAWSPLAIWMTLPASFAAQRAIMQSYLEGRLCGAPAPREEPAK